MTDDPAHPFSILDVLENVLDGDLTADAVRRLDLSAIAALAESVQDFYASWEPPPASRGAFRAHLGGWVAGNTSHAGARDILHTALLYAHEVLVHDPVAAYFEPRRTVIRGLPPIVHRSGMQVQGSQGHIESTGGWVNNPDLESAHSALAEAVEALRPLAPLVRAGVAIPVPHLRVALECQDGIFSAVRHMVRERSFRDAVESPVDGVPLTSDDAHGFRVMTEPVKSQADVINQNFGPVAFYLARTVAVADAFGASYLPPSGTDWALYADRLQSLLVRGLERRAHVDVRVASALGRSHLPLLAGLDGETVAKIHENEDAFEEWRRALRRAVRQIESCESAGEVFEQESREILEDELTPVAEEVTRSVSKSALLRERSRDAKVTLTSGVAVAGAGVAVGIATPAALATAAGSAFASWLVGALFPKKHQGARAVIAHLVSSGEGADPLPRPDKAVVIAPKRPFG